MTPVAYHNFIPIFIMNKNEGSGFWDDAEIISGSTVSYERSSAP